LNIGRDVLEFACIETCLQICHLNNVSTTYINAAQKSQILCVCHDARVLTFQAAHKKISAVGAYDWNSRLLFLGKLLEARIAANQIPGWIEFEKCWRHNIASRHIEKLPDKRQRLVSVADASLNFGELLKINRTSECVGRDRQ